jgi:hypothetical protein
MACVTQKAQKGHENHEDPQTSRTGLFTPLEVPMRTANKSYTVQIKEGPQSQGSGKSDENSQCFDWAVQLQ